MAERDELPWVKFAHWILMAPISPEAKVVYGLLASHVMDHEKGNRDAWPSQRRLAELLGYRRTETVDRSVKELEAYGLVVVDRGRHPTQPLRKRNTYRVRLAADPALDRYTGRLSVWERPERGTRAEPGSATAEPPNEPPEPGCSQVPEPGSSRVGEPGSARVEVEVVDGDRGDEERLPALLRRAGAPCGFPHCRGGIWKLGITEKPCPTCSKAA